MRIMAKYIPLILFTILTNFLSQILLKKGMTDLASVQSTAQHPLSILPSAMTNLFVLTGLAVMVISMGSHLLVLSKVQLSYAYPFLGLSFVLVAIWGYFALSEPMNIYRICGVAFIVCGVALVARS